MLKRILIVVLLVLVAGAAAYAWASRHPEIAAIEPPAPDSFDPALVERGQTLAAIGNCESCHTTPGGQQFAGGYSTATPFGVVYSTNITPDPVHGIGTWSEAAFSRALRSGIDREGRYLYPVFPYDHFTLVSDEDVSALYAYLMSRAPADVAATENQLDFPFDNRLLLAGWQVLHLEDRRFVPDPQRSDAWNRGAYLVEGLGHCGACHTPRTALGALDPDAKFAGAELAAGWYAPAMDEGSPAVVPWTDLAIVNYLLDGWDRDHGIAAGPMTAVVDNLGAHLSEDDAFAMAEYILPFLPQPEEVDRDALREAAQERQLSSQMLSEEELARTADDPVLAAGQELFAQSCANCHRQATDTVPLALATSVNLSNPGNLLAVTRYGIRPPQGVPAKTMPAFTGLTRDQLEAVARFARWRFTDQPPWENLEEALDEVLDETAG